MPLDAAASEIDMALPKPVRAKATASASEPKSKDKKAEQAKKPRAEAKKSSDTGEHSWAKVKNANKVADDAKAARKAPTSAKPVELDAPVKAGPQATMSIIRSVSTRGEAKGIGEVAGAATLLEIKVENDSKKKLDLQHAQIRLYYGKERVPAALLSDPRTLPLPAYLAAGKSVTASYVFSAEDQANLQVVVEFETGGTTQIQQLAGQVTK